MTKEQRKIKDLTAQVEDLTKKLEEEKSAKNYWSDRYCATDKELSELHTTFDVLGVPRRTNARDYAPDLSLSNRMTLYVAGVREGVKDKE